MTAIAEWMAAWARGERSDADFTDLARARFDQQAAEITAFGAYARARGVAAAANTPIEALPLVPVTAYKRAALHTAVAARTPVVRFETSGTTDGQPGVVQLADTALYDLSLRAAFHHFVVPDAALRLSAAPNAGPFVVVSLVPDRSLRPHSSLGHMVEVIGQTWGCGQVHEVMHASAHGAETLDIPALRRALDDARVAGDPVLLLTTSVALQLLHGAWPAGVSAPLPVGSRLMDTGGPKGRRVTLSRPGQHAWLTRTFGLAPQLIVGELGMTELASQRYETVARAHVIGDVAAARAYVAPPWLRTLVLNPTDLSLLPTGETGILGHIDLANVDTCAFVLTSDLGHLTHLAGSATRAGSASANAPLGLHVQGRAPGAEWRGCGLDADDLFGPAGS